MVTVIRQAAILLLVLILAATAELWASSLTGVALAALGLAVMWLCAATEMGTGARHTLKRSRSAATGNCRGRDFVPSSPDQTRCAGL